MEHLTNKHYSDIFRTPKMLSFILFGVSLLVGYGLILAVYRLLFHPLVKFPGPKLSAASYWYEFYYEIIQPGTWLWKIEKLHEQYGMS